MMGLLLGASIMTVCEVLDLFIYNSVDKIFNRKQGRRISGIQFPSEEKKEPLWVHRNGKSNLIILKLFSLYVYIVCCVGNLGKVWIKRISLLQSFEFGKISNSAG